MNIDLTRMPWPEVAAAVRDALVVPLGSLEQHGPHLPLDTDTTIAAAVARAVQAARPGSGLAPAVPYGASGEHAGFAGTVSIGTDAVRHLLVELVRDAIRDWPAVLLVNGHGGNLDAVTAALAQCHGEGRLVSAVHLGGRGMDAHAGRAETSLMLHLDPSRVRQSAAEAGATAPVAQLLPALRSGGVVSVSPNGVLGDPAGASAQEGGDLLRELVARALTGYDQLHARAHSREA